MMDDEEGDDVVDELPLEEVAETVPTAVEVAINRMRRNGISPRN